MQDAATNLIFQDIIKCIPKENKIYLVGGSVRNAFFYYYHNKKMPQRDYDILLIGDRKKFINNLRKNNFVYGKIKRKKEITLKKPKFDGAKQISDFVVLDIHNTDEKDINKNIRENSNFTINCNILPLKYANSENWRKKIISLPGALDDIKNKQIRINKITHPAQLFACIRLISKGFKSPTPQEINVMLEALKKIEFKKFNTNVKKMISYAGDEDKVKFLPFLKICGRLFIKRRIYKCNMQN